MANKTNPTAIGAFVVGAIVIAVAAVMILGSSKFFTQTEMFVSYFSESINGLDVGAPVKYKGVTIGKVEKIILRSPKPNDMRNSYVVLIYSIDAHTLSKRTESEYSNLGDSISQQIKDGLRARLNYQSIVTGMLYIELDFAADKNEPYVLMSKNPHVKEIPTAKSTATEMMKTLEMTLNNVSKIDFQELAENTNGLILTVNGKISQIDTDKINDSILKALEDADRLMSDPGISGSLTELNTLLKESRNFLAKLSGQVDDIAGSVDKTVLEVNDVMKNLNGIIAPQSPFRFELATALKNISDTFTSVRSLTDYLQRNPSSLIKGKAENEKLNRQ